MLKLGITLLTLLLAEQGMAISLRCNGTIVKQKMLKSEVREVCGDPVHTRGFVTTVKKKTKDHESLVYLHGEAWIYDLGSSARLKLVVFSNGMVSAVQLGNYPGKIAGKNIDCVEKKIRPGTSVDEIQYLCGTPDEKRITERQYVKIHNGEREVVLEDWQYSEGKRAKVFSFRDHRLANTTRRF